MQLALNMRLPTGEFERARDAGLAICQRAREAGAIGALANPLVFAADAAYRLGDWDFTDAATSEALRVAMEAGQHNWWGHALLVRARLDAARGQEAESGQAARGAIALSESRNLASGLTFGHAVLGFLELGLERVDEAIAELETVERLAAEHGLEEPILIPWTPDLIEAYVRAGRAEDAGRVLATLERQAGSTGTAMANAAAARCRGMLAGDFDAAFTEALALDDRRPMPFERARTLLAFGRRLHRARRRRGARPPPRGAGRVRAARRNAVGRPGAERAAGGGGAPSLRARRVTDPPGAARCGGRRPRRLQPGDRRRAVPGAKDGRVPPGPNLPQARRPIARPARCHAPTGSRATDEPRTLRAPRAALTSLGRLFDPRTQRRVASRWPQPQVKRSWTAVRHAVPEKDKGD